LNSQVCIDASFGLKLVLAEKDSERARSLWANWIQNDVQVFSCALVLYEGVAAIRGQVYRGLITSAEGDQAFRALQAQAVTLSSPPEIYDRAWNLAKTLNQPKVYDSYYLALAELMSCEFWTADERLFNAVSKKLPWVRWIGAP
jgi:predicted nucleic acid-binding protein